MRPTVASSLSETLRDWYLSREIDDVRSKMYDVRGKRDDVRMKNEELRMMM